VCVVAVPFRTAPAAFMCALWKGTSLQNPLRIDSCRSAAAYAFVVFTDFCQLLEISPMSQAGSGSIRAADWCAVVPQGRVLTLSWTTVQRLSGWLYRRLKVYLHKWKLAATGCRTAPLLASVMNVAEPPALPEGSRNAHVMTACVH
jgi:hypothetical protein